MNGYGSSEEHQPVTWLRGYPIYAAYLVVLVLAASLLGTTLLMFARADRILSALSFDSESVFRGEVWRVVTYGLLNPPTTIWFIVDLLMIAWFGRELEKFFGRRKFLLFYGCIYLLPPLLFLVIGLWQPVRFAGETGAFAVFVGFATLYPNAAIFFNLLAKWVAAILVAFYTLMALSYRDEVTLITLWATVGFAFAFVRYQQGALTLPSLPRFRPRPKLRVLPAPGEAGADAPMAEIDALLDKIAQSGISSLTPKERTKLESARADLLKKDSRRGNRRH